MLKQEIKKINELLCQREKLKYDLYLTKIKRKRKYIQKLINNIEANLEALGFVNGGVKRYQIAGE